MTSEETKRRRLRALRFSTAAKAYEIRIALLRILAPDGRCGKCRRRHRARKGNPDRAWARLEVHDIDGRDWSPREHSEIARARIYVHAHARGVCLAAWCRHCNAGDNPRRR